MRVNLQFFGGRGSSSGGGGSASDQPLAIASVNDSIQNAYDNGDKTLAINLAEDALRQMQVGDTITVKDYKKGNIMEFEKRSDGNTISAFKNILGDNQYASPQHVEGWINDSVRYAHYVPKFRKPNK